MENKIGRWLYWTPRILSIIFVIFLALMSLDVFELNAGFWGTTLALFLHNIPALVLLIVLILSWSKYEIIGGITYILGGLLYIILNLINIFQTGFEWYYLAWMLEISGIAFLIGILFLLNWYKKNANSLK